MTREIEVYYNSDFPIFLTVRPEGMTHPIMHAMLHLHRGKSRHYLQVIKMELIPDDLADEKELLKNMRNKLHDAVWAELGHHCPKITWDREK